MALSGWSFIIQPTNDLFLVGGLAGWTKAPRFSGRLVINDDFICRLLVYVRNRECQYTISVLTRATFQRLSSHRHLNLSQHSLLYPNGYRSPSSQSVASVASTSPQTHALHCSTIVFSSWATHSDKLIMLQHHLYKRMHCIVVCIVFQLMGDPQRSVVKEFRVKRKPIDCS